MWQNASAEQKSAVLHHLLEAEHEKVTLQNPNDTHIGKTTLQCNHCGQSNDFLITFASMESNSMTVALSRQMNERYSSRYSGLTEDRQFLSFSVEVPRMPSKKNQFETRLTSLVATVSIQDSKFELETVPQRFRDGVVYEKIFSSLIKREADYQKNLFQSIRKQVNITLSWSDLPNKKVRANFIIEYDDAVWKLNLGDRLKLSHSVNGSKWSGVGRIVKLPENYADKVTLEMDSSEGIPRDRTTGFTVAHVWISASYDRMLSAIRKLVSESSTCPNFLFERILGINSNEILFESSSCKLQPVPSLPTLSKVQANVVRNALQQSLTLIQGPTACGKTVILLNILYHLIQQNESPILVCAPTNVAVDHLALMINQMKLKVVRLCAEIRTFTDSPAHFLNLEKKHTVYLSAEAIKLRKLEEVGALSPKDAKRLGDLEKAADRHVLEDADVICCTCIGAGDSCLASMKFRAILIDESMQASEPECMIPIALGCDRLVLIGDYLQLKPVIMCEEVAKAGLKQSLFQRLVDIGVIPLLVTVQYRMNPKLWQFSSKPYHSAAHYEGLLQNGITAAQRKFPDQAFPWPIREFPLVFYNVRSWEERSRPVMSYINRGEAMIVEQIVTHLLKHGISPDRIGIITQYEGQRRCLELCMKDQGPLDINTYEKVEVNKVDAFQGREKDIIIVSCVRSPGRKGFGSFNDPARVSLALTRAKYGLIIVGHFEALLKIPAWKDMLTFCRQEGLMVETEMKFPLFDSHCEFI